MIFRGIVLFLMLISVWNSGFGQGPPRQLDLRECLNRASSQHPLIAAAQARMQGAEEFRKYVGVKPNPTVTVQTENWRVRQQPPLSLGRDLDIFVYGTQRMETGGKATRRRELADQQVIAADTEVEVVRLQLRRDVTRGYWTALQAQTLSEITIENRQDLDQLVQTIALRVREGFAPESELIRARLERQTLIGQELAAAQSLERAKLDLLKAMGETSFNTDFRLALPGQTGAPLLTAGSERLSSEALVKRPELMLLRARVETERANLRLQQASAKPDFEISAGYKRTGGFNTMIGYFTIPLPLFNRNLAEIGRAAAKLVSAEHELRAEENYVRAEIEAAYRAAKGLQERIQEMERDFLKPADESRKIALIAYREGAASLYQMLESQRARNDARLLYFRTRHEFQQALMELDLLIGRELE